MSKNMVNPSDENPPNLNTPSKQGIEGLDSDAESNGEKEKEQADFQAKALEKFTGGRFIPYKVLVDIIQAYQSKEHCEDVDALEQLGLDNLFEGLETSLEKGIAKSTIEERKIAYGDNMPPLNNIKGCLTLFIEALNDFTLIVLMIAAVVSIIVNMITEKDHRETGSYIKIIF